MPDLSTSSLDRTLEAIHAEARARLLSTTIEPHDAAELRGYFRACGRSTDVSVMGAQLDALARYAHGARPCRRCGGDPKRNIGGCGWMPEKPGRRAPTPAEQALLAWQKKLRRNTTLPTRADVPCTSCEGTGWVKGRPTHGWRTLEKFWVSRRVVNGVSKLVWQGPYRHADAEAAFDALSCEHDEVTMAKARALSVPTTAQPTGSSVPLGGPTLDDAQVHQFAVMARRLNAMRARWPLSVDVLDSYYGHDGGHEMALWALTAAGKTLLRRNSRGLDPFMFFENEREDAHERHDAQRLALMQEAGNQARELLDGACALWNLVKAADQHTRPEPTRFPHSVHSLCTSHIPVGEAPSTLK